MDKRPSESRPRELNADELKLVTGGASNQLFGPFPFTKVNESSESSFDHANAVNLNNHLKA